MLDICRLCLNFVNVTNIFSENLNTKIMASARIKVERDDGIPQNVCFACVNSLNIAFKFRHLCEMSDFELRSSLNKIYPPDEIFELHDRSSISDSQSNVPVVKLDIEKYQDKNTNSDVNKVSEDRVADLDTRKGTMVKTGISKNIETAKKKSPDSVLKKVTESTAGNSKICASCGKIFKKSCQLIVHSRIHTGERPYVCVICGKTFRVKHHFVAHSRIHNGEKPFQCLHCGRCFTENSTLVRHVKIHTNERKISCTLCHQRFKTTYDAKLHIMRHTGEKRFICNICQKEFSDSSGLCKHKPKHTVFISETVLPPHDILGQH